MNLVLKLHRQHVPKQDVILVYSSLCTVFPTTVHTVHEAIGVEGWGKGSVCGKKNSSQISSELRLKAYERLRKDSVILKLNILGQSGKRYV